MSSSASIRTRCALGVGSLSGWDRRAALRGLAGRRAGGIPPWSFSPDRSLLALARNDGGAARSLRIVDVGRMRVSADVPIAGGAVGLVAWPARGRMLALQEICCDEQQQLLAVDVARRRVDARRPLGGTVVRVGRTPRELVLLVAPAKEIGPARLALVDSRGAVRLLRLERMLAGERLLGRSEFRVERRLPGLAVDPKGRRAFVVGRGLVAAVDLVSLAVSYHELARPASLLGRLRDWLDPAAYAKGASGPTRTAHWLGGGLLAVAGADEKSFTDARGEHQTRIRPAGLSLADTRNWSVRTIDRGATDVRVAGELLLATGVSTDSASGEEDVIGLAAYGFDGERRFQSVRRPSGVGGAGLSRPRLRRRPATGRTLGARAPGGRPRRWPHGQRANAPTNVVAARRRVELVGGLATRRRRRAGRRRRAAAREGARRRTRPARASRRRGAAERRSRSA
jgi:hypothetical protein